jgi:hypothetical protein
MQLDGLQLDGRPCLRQRRASLSVRYGRQRQQRDSDENPAMVARTVRPPQNTDRGAALVRRQFAFRSLTPADSRAARKSTS